MTKGNDDISNGLNSMVKGMRARGKATETKAPAKIPKGKLDKQLKHMSKRSF